MRWIARATRAGVVITCSTGESLLLSWSQMLALLARRPKRKARHVRE